MSEQRRALITGITGQDGSFLADLLLEKGYEVHGMVRRSSTETFQRLTHIRDAITLHTGDLLDQRSLTDVLRATSPHEIYNLAAMSFVAASWNQPVLTAEFTGTGVTRMLEAMREVAPESRFYQASSSEMFGNVREVPQTELTPFYPRSPYGVAKAYGHHITVNYRESYDLFACSGILFNHECCALNTPLMIRRNGIVSVETPADLMPLRRKGPSVQSHEPADFTEIWDGGDWVQLYAVSAIRRRRTDPDHRMLSIETRAGIANVTAHHRMLSNEREDLRADSVEVGDRLALGDLPPEQPWTVLTEEMAELLGYLAADGYVDGTGRTRFVNNDASHRTRVAELWSRVFLGSATWRSGVSGFDRERSVERVDLNAPSHVAGWLRAQLYTATRHKQVPPLVLNAEAGIRHAFLKGYYAGDGLKAGKGMSVKTNSPVLAQGLCWLYHLQSQPASVYAEQREGRTYYQLNLAARVTVGGSAPKGQHLRKDPAEVRRVVESTPEDDEWVFDLETESGVFCAGVGRLVVHNSERRGLEFVTRKVTHGAAAIKLGLQTDLSLGNLDAERDWGYAKDYVEAMWLMLQQDEPDDYVIATNEAHSVRELVQIAFERVGLSSNDHVRIDPQFYRPAEVDHLIGDYTKAKEKLGWEPRTNFEQLVNLMVDADLELLARGVPQKQAG
ncbi:MAG TPA: GDP-mannose 4,6-dehydratase [Thermoleophilaceae bacterium]